MLLFILRRSHLRRSPHPTPHTPHPTPHHPTPHHPITPLPTSTSAHLNYLICAMIIVLG
ncbi:hypothetical protein N44_01427 [Microcystis aeruginosa NIES-44]|uniref:Uncharacterized protein n=1 Tax=Microcystis aeruginosa NIES-44 TaxID=449439 RepID=A0A0A1VTE2_MICAE|nr:hypothetical protein N44_01427 [Microcystis aeruginosa NIES-44]